MKGEQGYEGDQWDQREQWELVGDQWDRGESWDREEEFVVNQTELDEDVEKEKVDNNNDKEEEVDNNEKERGGGPR